MRLLLRILLIIPLAYVTACIGAAFFILVALGASQAPAENVADVVGKALAVSILGAPFVGAVAAVPALIVIVLAETFGWRSLVLHLLIGVAIGMFALVLVGRGEPTHLTNGSVGAAAGAVGAVVYWLIAGRNAGARSEQPVAPSA